MAIMTDMCITLPRFLRSFMFNWPIWSRLTGILGFTTSVSQRRTLRHRRICSRSYKWQILKMKLDLGAFCVTFSYLLRPGPEVDWKRIEDLTDLTVSCSGTWKRSCWSFWTSGWSAICRSHSSPSLLPFLPLSKLFFFFCSTDFSPLNHSEVNLYSHINICVCVYYIVLVMSNSLWLWMIAHQAPLHEILQARILEWFAVLSSRGSSWPRDWTCAS